MYWARPRARILVRPDLSARCAVRAKDAARLLFIADGTSVLQSPYAQCKLN